MKSTSRRGERENAQANSTHEYVFDDQRGCVVLE